MKLKAVLGITLAMLLIGTLTLAFNIQPAKTSYTTYTRTYLPNEWISDGVAMGWYADDASWSYAMPFDFPFYGTNYGTIYISSNGLITFIGPDSSWSNSISGLAGRLAIAPAWDDWRTDQRVGDDIYIWQPDSDHVIIRWQVVAYYATSIFANFEAILGSDGAIKFNYWQNNGPISATVGISNGVDEILAEDLTDLNYINTILFTPFRPEHDLEVHLEAPTRLAPSQSTILNATVQNLGLNNETNVELQLLTNGTIVDSVIISELLAGSSYTLSYTWTPTVEGLYNVTAYATPAPGEIYVANNQETMFVTVRGPTVHNINTGLDYFTVQEAIDAPETLNGHMILVDGGIYYEHVSVYKSLNLQGENRETTIIDGGGSGSVVDITVDWVNITGFTVRSGDYGVYGGYNIRNNTISNNIISNNGGAGIYFEYNPSGNTISNNIISNNGRGIYMVEHRGNSEYEYFIGGNTISHNTISNNYGHGIDMGNGYWYYGENTISHNNISNNWGSGIYYGYWICWNTISHNIISNNNGFGIYMAYNPSLETITNNTISYNGQGGIWSQYAIDNTISHNTISNNGGHGIYNTYYGSVGFVYNNTISNNSGNGIYEDYHTGGHEIRYNTISNNIVGICVSDSWDRDEPITGNTISDNQYGIIVYSGLPAGSQNVYHNDFINNVVQAQDYGSGNQWDNGYPSGGNYWSDYTGVDLKSGPNQDQPGGDGIGDTRYNIAGTAGSQDRYPLMYPGGLPPPEHELAVSLETPSSITVGQSCTLNATVYNSGLNNETEVELQLLINGSVVDSIIIPELLIGSSYTLSYPWTPTTRGFFNVTAYAPPVVNETFTTNNIATKIVEVMPKVQTHRYIVTGGFAKIFLELWTFPFRIRERLDIPFTPWQMYQNIMFSDPDPTTGVVHLSISAESYRGLNYTWYNEYAATWLRIRVILEEDGYGWLFTGSGTNPIQGDVDIITYNNYAGVYFFGPDGLAGTADDLPAMYLGELLQLGADGIPGTPDDPPGTWGDGTPDPIGSSVLYLPLTLQIEFWDGMNWGLICSTLFPVTMTTATAYDIVIEPISGLNGVYSEEVGHPWEYLHSGAVWNSTYKDPACNVYVEYVCSWSMLGISTAIGNLDLMWEIKEHKEKALSLGDVNDDGKVNMEDISIACYAFASFPAHPRWTPNADVNSDGKVDMMDIAIMCYNFLKHL